MQIFHAESVAQLQAELQAFSLALPFEDQARAALHILLDRVVSSEPQDSREVDPHTCPNCDRAVTSTRTPYCSVQCREEAGFIRQFRAGLRDGTIFDPDRQVAFGQNLWHLLGGGRPLRRGLIPEKVIAKVIEKADGKCAQCGGNAVTVDHLGTGCNRPFNLRPVCEACCRIFDFLDPAVLGRPEAQRILSDLAARIAAPTAIRPCDDAASWDWRAFVRGRQAG